MGLLAECSMLLLLGCAAACSGGNSDAKSPVGSNGGAGGSGTGATGGTTVTTNGGGPAATGGGGVAPVAAAGASGAGATGGGMLASSLTCNQPWPANAPTLKTDSWTAINPAGVGFNGEPSNGVFLQGMAIDRCNPSTIYVGANSFDPSMGGLFKTVDAGANWTRVSALDEPVRVRVDPKDPNHLYVGDGVRGQTLGFWVSHDGGNSFKKPPGYVALLGKAYTLDDIYDIAVDPADFNHFLMTYHSPWGTAANMSNSGVMESKNGGDDWIVHDPQPTWQAGLNVWFLGSPIKWLVGTQADGYWRTEDSGGHWTHVSTSLMTHGGGQLYTTKAGIMYLSSFDGVLKSSDNAVTWEKVPSGVGPSTSVFGDGTNLYAHHCYAYGSVTFTTALESADQTWSPFGEMYTDGAFEMAYDDVNHIIYSSNWGNGLLARKVP